MQKIDRLVWAEGACFESYGVRVGIRANHTGALQELLPYLTPSWSQIEPPRKLDHLYSWLVGGEHRPNVRSLDLLYSGAGRILRTAKREELFDAFERHLRINVALLSRRFVFIHAGVVAWRGRAVVMPGRTFTGKSTLVKALVQAGADYFSDEYAVLDKDGRVHPYAKPISIRMSDTLIQQPVAIKEIGGRKADGPMKVGVILATRYRKGAKARFREASHGQGALDLIGNAVAARFTPRRVLRIAGKVSVGSLTLRGTRGEAQATAEHLLRALNEFRVFNISNLVRGDIHDIGENVEFTSKSDRKGEIVHRGSGRRGSNIQT